MIDYKDIEGHLFALIVWNLDKEDDVHVYVGQLIKRGTDYLFNNDKKGWTVTVHPDKIDKIKKVTDDLKETLLHADYCLNLTIGDMVDNNGKYIPTGMKWHE
jgi:hypothetical protein